MDVQEILGEVERNDTGAAAHASEIVVADVFTHLVLVDELDGKEKDNQYGGSQMRYVVPWQPGRAWG